MPLCWASAAPAQATAATVNPNRIFLIMFFLPFGAS
jgi:hypothetical protein